MENLKREYIETVNELFGISADSEVNCEGMSDQAVVGLMICRRLDRLCDSIEKLTALSDCVNDVGKAQALCVVGNMMNE